MKGELEQFIDKHRDELDKSIPDPAVLQRILGQMQVDQKKEVKGIVIPFRVLQWAAACLIIIGGGITLWLMQNNTGIQSKPAVAIIKGDGQKDQDSAENSVATAGTTTYKIVKRQSVDSVDEELAARQQVLLAKLNSKKMYLKKQVLFASLKNMDSPASRINATSEIYQLKNAGKDVVDVLVQTLNNDPSANVRIAALDGLARFYKDSYVRKKLVASLKKQQDPVVQIAVIDLLTRMKESAVLSELDQLVGDDNTNKAVKDCAYSSMFRLRSS